MDADSGPGNLPMRILIVDDEPNIRKTLRVALEAMGHAVEEASTTASATSALARRPADVALVDLRLGTDSGLDLIEPFLAEVPRLAIVVITAHASIDSAVDAMRRGAFDYLPKPFTPGRRVRRAVIERVGCRCAGSATASRTPGEPGPRR